jgi:putative ABC transport system ATP-binding protein
MPVLRLSQVTKVFGSGAGEVRALDAVDFQLEPMEVVVVMGPSGSGKTTLLTIAGALQHPTSGVVEVDGEEIQGYSQQQLNAVRRRKVGFVFQSFNLLQALTALENIQFVLELNGSSGRSAKDRARALLTDLDLGHRLHELPKRLSGGEQQRVAVARSLANGAPLILADEPTANLDQKRAVDMLEMFRGIARDMGRAILLVTHDMRAHDHADRIFWLEDGKLQQIEHDDAHLRPHTVRRDGAAPATATAAAESLLEKLHEVAPPE